MATALMLWLVGSGTGELARYRDRNRVLVVFGSSRSPLVRRQRTAIDPAGARERDLVVLAATPHLAKELHVPQQGFMVILVGKDGQIKLQSKSVIPGRRLNAIIDTMPMRRAEMARRRP